MPKVSKERRAHLAAKRQESVLALQRLLDSYFRILENSGRPLPRQVEVRPGQLATWRQMRKGTTYKGVFLYARVKRRAKDGTITIVNEGLPRTNLVDALRAAP